MNFKLYCKLYALPCGILLIGFLIYYILFDSLNQYKRNYLITIIEKQEPSNEELLEQKRIHEELQAIKESANVDFIKNTLSTNINKIHSSTNNELQKEEAQKIQSNP